MDWHLHENLAIQSGYSLIAGVDEVGRGCLAGPVVAAAVIFPQGCWIDGVNDSKKLSAQKRERLFPLIKQRALAYAVEQVLPVEIDQINILQASLKAMRLSIMALQLQPELVLVDGRDVIPGVEIPQRPIIDGDAQSFSIAAASILAKVLRDRLMGFYARKFSGYGFERNKGYGTLEHRWAIGQIGPCSLHRRSFRVKNDQR